MTSRNLLNPLLTACAAMPVRQLQLLLGGSLAVVAALFWMLLLRAPLAQVRALQAERDQLQQVVAEVDQYQRGNAALELELTGLKRGLNNLDPQRSTDQLLLEQIRQVDQRAAHHAVLLRGATPGPISKAVTFDEIPFDLEAEGRYQDLVDWMNDIDSAMPTLAIVRFALHPADTPGQLTMKLRLAAYRAPASRP